jgi:hypothetical protein
MYIYNNYFSDMFTFVITLSTYVWNNTFIRSVSDFDPTAHGNVVESNGCQLIVWNNYSDTASGGVTYMHGLMDNSTDYDFNNVLVNQRNQAIQIDNYSLLMGVGSGIYVFNNTIQLVANFTAQPITGAVRQGNVCVGGRTCRQIGFIYTYNNHLIGDYPTTNFGGFSPAAHGSVGDIGRSNAQATSDGYTQGSTYDYFPASGSGITVGAGTSRASICSLIPDSGPAIPSTDCLREATYGVNYDNVNHKVLGVKRTPVSRGSSWDVGAYAFAVGTTVPSPPTNLTATTP